MPDILQKIIQIVTPWLLDHGVKIVAIIIIAYLIHKFARIFIEKFIRKIVISDHFLTKEAEKKREEGVLPLFLFCVIMW